MTKVALFLAFLAPAADLAWDAALGPISANPYPTAISETGLWAMRLLVAGLALGPAQRRLGWRGAGRFRRMVGLFAAFYTAVHVIVWCKDYEFAWGFLAGEIGVRLYLATGTLAAALLVPLAATSFDVAARRLGGRNWRRLHRGVYAAAVLAWIHFLLAGRLPRPELLIEGAALAVLLAFRLRRKARTEDRPLRETPVP